MLGKPRVLGPLEKDRGGQARSSPRAQALLFKKIIMKRTTGHLPLIALKKNSHLHCPYFSDLRSLKNQVGLF